MVLLLIEIFIKMETTLEFELWFIWYFGHLLLSILVFMSVPIDSTTRLSSRLMDFHQVVWSMNLIRSHWDWKPWKYPKNPVPDNFYFFYLILVLTYYVVSNKYTFVDVLHVSVASLLEHTVLQQNKTIIDSLPKKLIP